MRRTKEQAAETRRAIQQAAEALFLQEGYEAVSLDEIAATAGVTRGAVHFHFGNKLGLLSAIRDRIGMPMRDLSERLAAGTTSSPLDALGDAIEATLANLQSDPRHRRLLGIFMAVETVTEEEADEMRRFRGRVRGLVAEIFAVAEARGALAEPWTARAAARAFDAMVDGFIHEWVRGETDFELVPDAVAIIRTLLATWATGERP